MMKFLEMQFSCHEDMAKLYQIQVDDVNKQIGRLSEKLKAFVSGKDAAADYVKTTKDELIYLQNVIKTKSAAAIEQVEKL